MSFLEDFNDFITTLYILDFKLPPSIFMSKINTSLILPISVTLRHTYWTPGRAMIIPYLWNYKSMQPSSHKYNSLPKPSQLFSLDLFFITSQLPTSHWPSHVLPVCIFQHYLCHIWIRFQWAELPLDSWQHLYVSSYIFISLSTHGKIKVLMSPTVSFSKSRSRIMLL